LVPTFKVRVLVGQQKSPNKLNLLGLFFLHPVLAVYLCYCCLFLLISAV
jgi:hypothetical protein